tara:strand:+ start:394 stop:582 length:189 start_codon:yes stop_codon:yes gene_type:complete
MKVGDIVERRGNRPWFDKKGTLVQIKYVHGDAQYGVLWFGRKNTKVQFFKKTDLKLLQAAGT